MEDLVFIRIVFLLAPFVLVPLGIGQLLDEPDYAGSPLLLRLRRLVGPAAMAAFVACWMPIGSLAATAGGALWLSFTLALGLLGAARLVVLPERFEASAVPRATALVFAAVGGAWLFFSAYGRNPLGFNEPIVMLTAVHFHFAGFAALGVVAAWGRRILASPATRLVRVLYVVATLATVVGPLLVALGITWSRDLEFAAVLVFAGGLLLFALVAATRLGALFRLRRARIAAGIALASLAVSTALAVRYALGMRFGITPIGIPEMARTHGLLNAFGFALPGLLAPRLDR